MSTEVLTSPSVERKCSFSQVQASAEVSGLSVTWAADEAVFMPMMLRPSVSGTSLTPYRSMMLAGEPWAWLRMPLPWAAAQACQRAE